ncbi:MAG: hypothetical protein HC821_05250 [Lewinella sp.]|nr:hypothetical protein [Lewinella sp.]
MEYQLPPQNLAELVDIQPDPLLLFGPHEDWLAVADRESFPSIESLREPALKLAGMRINPATFAPHAMSGFTNLRLRNLKTRAETPIIGLPTASRLRNLRWSPDGDRLIFCLITPCGLQLWAADFATAVAQALSPPDLSASLGGSPYEFLGNNHLIIRRRPPQLGPPPTAPPAGPMVQDSSGQESANRTHQNLLQSPHEEALFRYYATVQLYCLHLATLALEPWAAAGMITSLDEAPGGEYLLITYLEEPFSYRVPHPYFADRVELLDRSGKLITTLAHRPVADQLPPAIGAVIPQSRRYQWRSDHSAQLYWVEAQDGGDPRNEVPFHDQLFFLEAPFESAVPQASLALPLRLGSLQWCRGDLAIAIDWRWKDRRQVVRRWFPDEPQRPAEILFDLNWEDKYQDPGSFLTTTLPNEHTVLMTRGEMGEKLVLLGNGHAEAGEQPFLAEYNLQDSSIKRLWQSSPPAFERPVYFRPEFPDSFIISRESNTERPNFFLRHFSNKEEIPLNRLSPPLPRPQKRQV